MRKFKRSTHTIVTTILFGLSIIPLVKSCQVEYTAGNLFGTTLTQSDTWWYALSLLFLVVWAIALFCIPPDFKYLIKIMNDCIIFEMSEEDHRRINKSFIMASKTKNHIVLDDGVSRIKIAYNKEVLEFLNEIND